jgi:hypothetical protein
MSKKNTGQLPAENKPVADPATDLVTPIDTAEKIHQWAVEVGGTEEKADEILGQDDRNVHHLDEIEKLLDIPEKLDTADGKDVLLDASDEDGDACLHVMTFEPESDSNSDSKSIKEA